MCVESGNAERKYTFVVTLSVHSERVLGPIYAWLPSLIIGWWWSIRHYVHSNRTKFIILSHHHATCGSTVFTTRYVGVFSTFWRFSKLNTFLPIRHIFMRSIVVVAHFGLKVKHF